MDCVCGSKQFSGIERPNSIVVDGKGTSQPATITLAECQKCGLIRQLQMPLSTNEQYLEYYRKSYPPTQEVYSKKDYTHDREVAELRCNEYDINKGNKNKILDIGSGSGAFVDECRSRGAEAYGCEISTYSYADNSDYIYIDQFENIHFPTDHFELVTCHDVLEHVLDPVKFLKEMFRTVGQEGTCIIDIPDFFHAKGRHHWKDVEHIWFFKTGQLKRLLKKIGFVVKQIKHPLEAKTVFYLQKLKQNRIKILFPPGIGDSYWSIVKLQAFLESKNIKSPVDAYVVCNRDRYNGHKRAFPFMEMFPFLNSTGKAFDNGNDPKLRSIWKEAYARQGKIIFENVHGCDYFIAYNGHLRFGKQLEEIDSLKCNWTPPMFVSLEQERFRKECIAKYGKYILFYFPLYGTFQYWTQEFPVEAVIESVKQIIKHTGHTPVFVGAAWDAEDKKCRQLRAGIGSCVDLSGKTNIEQLFGLIKGSQAVIGYPSGLPIMSAVFDKKTLIIWNDFYDQDFAWHSCPPWTKNKTYFVEFTKNLTPENLTERVVEIITGKKIKVNPRVLETNARPIPNWELTIDNMKKKKEYLPENITSVVNHVKEYKKTVTVMCVLKSGGDFTVDYVVRLRNMIARNTTIPYKFICLTDMEIPSDICESIKLKHNYNRWWSKIEMFRHGITNTERILYFDLDSVITSNIDDILISGQSFIALKPWNRTNQKDGLCASGMMAWENGGTYSFIYNQFKISDIGNCPRGDQEYISKVLTINHKKPVFFQDVINGIYSYKRNCRQGIPGNARVVCFHGRPRPHQVNEPWIKENWR